MNVEFINPFLSSLSNVLVTMATMQVKPGKIFIDDQNLPKGDITGLISMHSNKADGTLAISFSKEVILDVCERMLGEPFDEINEEVENLVGEITNMVTGGAKQILDEKGYDFDMARPTVSTKKQALYDNNKQPALVIPFDSDKGRLYIQIQFNMKNMTTR